MDDKHLNIDEWLRKAAAAQPAPEDTGMEAKQQAWSKMAALLEEQEAGKPQPRLFRFRFNRAAIIIPIIAATTAFAAVWLGVHLSGNTERPSINTPQHHDKQQQSARPDTLSITGINTPAAMPADTPSAYSQPQPPSMPADTDTVLAGPVAGNSYDPASSSPAASQPGGKVPAATGQGKKDNTAPPRNTAAANISKDVKDKTGTAHAGRLPAAGKPLKEEFSLHNKVNKTTGEDSARDNEPLASGQTVTDIRRRPSAKESKGEHRYTGLPGDPSAGNSLFPLRTRNVFALQLPSLSDASRDQRVPEARGGGGLHMGDGSSRWALQAGLLASPGNGYGLRVGILYAYQLNDRFYIQPQLSAGYMTGYDKAFTHVSVSEQRRDSSGTTGPAYYDIDSTITPFTLKNTFAASAGINFGYTKNRLAVSTGPVYSYAMASGKKDSVSVYPSVFNDSTGLHTPVNSPAFSKGRLPGIHQLSWNIDVSYYLLPRLQAGINYRFVLLRSKGDKGFMEPVKTVQDAGLLELYIRIPLGKQ